MTHFLALNPSTIECSQGSVLGLILFTMYAAPFRKLTRGFKYITHHLSADDKQIYTSISPENAATDLRTLQDCISAVQKWMPDNKLKLNPDKTKFLLIVTASERAELAHFSPIDLVGSQ